MSDFNAFGVIIQARANASRLPGKMTREFFDGKTILEILLAKLVQGLPDVPIIVATTDNEIDNEIAYTVKKSNIPIYRGNELNVLNRIISASNYFGIENIIRVCADNPFLHIESITALIEIQKIQQVDYCSFLVGDQQPAITSHVGLYAEITKKSTLENVASRTNELLYLEHVTNYIYTHPKIFKLKFATAPQSIYNRNDIRLTVDTEEDFVLAQSLFSIMIENNWSQFELIDFIDSNEMIKNSMQKMIAQNKK